MPYFHEASQTFGKLLDEENHLSSAIVDIVSSALGQTRLSALSEVLEKIAGATEAWGSILWQAAPGSDPQRRRGELRLLAEWFPEDDRFSKYNIPLDRSVTGEAIAEQSARWVDIHDPRVFPDPFLKESGVRFFCSLPIRFADGNAGALNLYRISDRPFNPEETAEAEVFAALVPDLYQTIRDRVSFRLLNEVNQTLHEAELAAQDEPLSHEDMADVVQQVCTLVNEALECIQTSAFLEDPLTAPGRFELIATTWPGGFNKTVYRADKADGLTGWVLAEGKPVRIPNLSHFENDLPALWQEYPGIVWSRALDVDKVVQELLAQRKRDWLPLSFLAVPICKGKQILGALRCSVAKVGPYSFADHEERLLMLVSAQLGRAWSSWLGRRKIDEEYRTWRALVSSIQELNTFVLGELAQPQVGETRIFDKLLEVTSSMIPGAEITDVRLVDEEKKDLYFAATYGSAWHMDCQELQQKRRQKRFPLDDPQAPSAGARVVATGEVSVLPDVREESMYSETFSDTRRLIVAPMISVSGPDRTLPKVLGVLDIRGTEDREFPSHAAEIAGVLGSQLGLYHDLASTIGRLRRLQEIQIQTFQDLKHQIRSPIAQALKRVELTLTRPGLDEHLKADLWKIRGLTRKAVRVSLTTGLFADLARKKALTVKEVALSSEELRRLLIEASMDHRFMNEPYRKVTCWVETKGLDAVRELVADRGLLEQVVNDLLDNAFKYSYDNTQILISGGITKTGRFCISVTNRGIPINTRDCAKCVERGWQGEEAKLVRGEGSGIGLWITDHVMRAHGGELMIIPTTRGVTEVKLLFPERRYRR